ncbi:hypothetical protein ABKN59_006182 [Abortiporus biennis]
MLASNSAEISDMTRDRVALNLLPYDLLFNVAQSLEYPDICSLLLTCKSLHDFVLTRPVFRNLAVSLLRRCRALPLTGFQRLSDLSTEQLVSAVTKATCLERAWLLKTPSPSRSSPYTDSTGSDPSSRSWYKIISAPPGEEVDWLSPITSSYKWNPNERWELWKCRVEFDIRTVFFTMAKVLHKSTHDRYDDRLMEFVLMKLEFSESNHDSPNDPPVEPKFSPLASFRTMGVVMNVFLLDPSSRLLSAFVWVSTSNTIGLYALLDWDKSEYVFVDTGIECTTSSNWSCILYKEQIVIHSEESDVAYQYFYPISVLQNHMQHSTNKKNFAPVLSTRLSPTTTLSGKFIFPKRSPVAAPTVLPPPAEAVVNGAAAAPQDPIPQNPPALLQDFLDADGFPTNPFPFPPWYPESAHFVRQWWPTLPTVPRLSCTVVLLADHDPDTHRTRYVLAQHYFKVPLVNPVRFGTPSSHTLEDGSDDGGGGGGGDDSNSSSSSAEHTDFSYDDEGGEGVADESMLKIWYVSEPFEVVCVVDATDDDMEDGFASSERPRPLMAVDFGHAVWVEFDMDDEGSGDESSSDQEPPRRLRFVSFPPVVLAKDDDRGKDEQFRADMARQREGVVRTLEVPPELDLKNVETINVDQSQGAVIISVKQGKIFILCYE